MVQVVASTPPPKPLAADEAALVAAALLGDWSDDRSVDPVAPKRNLIPPTTLWPRKGRAPAPWPSVLWDVPLALRKPVAQPDAETDTEPVAETVTVPNAETVDELALV